MHDHITSITQNPTQNIHNKLKNPKKKISKTQNLGVNAWMHENIVRRRVWWLGQKLDGLKDFSEGEVFGLREREKSIERKIKRMNFESHLILK